VFKDLCDQRPMNLINAQVTQEKICLFISIRLEDLQGLARLVYNPYILFIGYLVSM